MVLIVVCCKLHSMQPGLTCHLDVSTVFSLPLKMGGRQRLTATVTAASRQRCVPLFLAE